MDAHAALAEFREQTVPFRMDGETATTWYRITGDLQPNDVKAPLIVLHGGPGAAHDYLLSLADLASDGRAVIRIHEAERALLARTREHVRFCPGLR